MGIWMSFITFKNLITDNQQKKDECEEILKLFKVVASLQVKMLNIIVHDYLTNQCILMLVISPPQSFLH